MRKIDCLEVKGTSRKKENLKGSRNYLEPHNLTDKTALNQTDCET